MNDDFEKRLQSQRMRRVPTEWRDQILQRARQSNPSTPDPLARRSPAKAARPSFLSAVLWPNPKAWAGLAAVWVAIFVLQFASRGNSQVVANASAPMPSTFLTSLKDQQQTLVELIGINQPIDADQPRRSSPQPRSELRDRFSLV